MADLSPMQIPATFGIQMDNETVEFDLVAFDNNIINKGVKMTHYRALRSPVGMIDSNDIRKPDEDHVAASSGWIYRKAGDTYGLATGNGKRDKMADVGDIEGSTIRVTFPRRYVDGTPMRLAIFDRFYLSEENDVVAVPHWQIFNAHETGTEKLTYPIHEVELLFGSDGTEYNRNDYDIDRNGQLVWVGSKRPVPGSVCSIRYTFRPFWYVFSIEHEIRIAAQHDAQGKKSIMRAPQAVLLQRERVFENEKRDSLSNTPGSLRQVKGSPDGSFGPR